MRSELSEHSTESLLLMLSDEVDRGRDFAYEVEQSLFKRWRDGIDIEPLIDLIQSASSRDRMRGAYYVGEADPRSSRFAEAAMGLSDDNLAYCRMMFVGYVTNTGLYDESIGIALAKCMVDRDLMVRNITINWAVYTTDDRFADFSRRVEAGTGVPNAKPWREFELKRGSRALTIARRLRCGEAVAQIRKDTLEEDSFTFDHLQVFEGRLRRYAERRRATASPNAASRPDGFDEYEVGDLGEQYDNLGKLKGDLPRFVSR